MTHQTKSYKKFVATAATATLVASALAPVASAATDFTDVSKDYKEAVDYIVNKGIAQGTTDTTFGTSQNISRGDAAVMIANALGLDTENAKDAGFQDVNNRVAGAVNAIVEAGIASGRTSSKFDPAAYITRQEMAKMLANAYELTATKDSGFTDVNKNWEEYVGALKEAGITLGKNETTFAPTANLTRGEFALFMFRAETMEETPEVPEETDIKVKSVSAITATTVTVEIDAPETDLVDQTVVVKDGTGKVYAVNATTIKAGATTATFNFTTPLTVNPTEQWTVNGVAYKAAELAIVGVEKVDRLNKYLNVTFNQKVTSLDPSQISVRETVAQTQTGVKSVVLSADGYSAQVELLGGNDSAVLKPLTSYTLSITKDGKVISNVFEIPNVAEDALVYETDFETRTIKVAGPQGGTFKVPTDLAFDFQEALGRDITVWTNKIGEVTRYTLSEEEVLLDAIKVTEKDGKTYINTVNGKKSYQVDTVEVFNPNGVSLTDNNTYNSAKVVIGKNGLVQSVIAKNYTDSILVSETSGNYVKSADNEINVKDYQITRDGKTIKVSDLKANEVLFFDASKKLAEVYTSTVTGTISNFYDGEFKLDGKVYKHGNAEVLVDGKFETLDDDSIKPFTKSVIAYLDREGNLIYLTGELAEATTATTVGYVTSTTATSYTTEGDPFVKFNIVDTKGAKSEEKVNIKGLKKVIKGTTEYEVGKASVSGVTDKIVRFDFVSGTGLVAVTKDAAGTESNNVISASFAEAAKGETVELVKDTETGVVTSLAFTDQTGQLAADAKLTDKTVKVGAVAYKVNAATPVFVENKDGSITATEWGKLPTTSVKQGPGVQVFTNWDADTVAKKETVKYFVIDADQLDAAENVDTLEGVVVSSRLKDNKLAEVTMFVNGEEKVYSVDEKSVDKDGNPVTNLTQAELVAGTIVDFEVNKSTGKLQTIVADKDDKGTIVFNNPTLVNTSQKTLDGKPLADNAKFYKVTKVGNTEQVTVIESLADLANEAVNNNVRATYSTLNAGSSSIDVVVITTVVPVTFTPAVNNDTVNDVNTLGIVGTTAVPGSSSIATADIVGGKVEITSVGVGSAVITVKDNDNKEATIDVTVNTDGSITLGSIARYENKVNDTAITVANDDTAVVSADPTIASVSGFTSGTPGTITVTAVKPGSTTVTVTHNDSSTTVYDVTVASTGAITVVAR